MRLQSYHAVNRNSGKHKAMFKEKETALIFSYPYPNSYFHLSYLHAVIAR